MIQKVNETRQTAEKEEYVLQVKSQRAAAGEIAVWNSGWNGLSRAAWNGDSPKYGLTASAAVIRAAYMLVYGRVDFF